MCPSVLPNSCDSWSSNILHLAKKKYGNVEILGRGWRSIVLGNESVVIKICKSEEISRREYLILKELQGLPFVPRLYGYDKDLNGVLMERIRGVPLYKFIKKAGKKDVRKVVRLSLLIAIILDILGYENPEFNRPLKHIIVGNGFPKLIDYERFRKKEFPGNFTKLSSFFFVSGGVVGRIVRRSFGIENPDDIISFLREYKRRFKDIRESILDP